MKDLRDYYKTPPKVVIEGKDDGVKSANSPTGNAHLDEKIENSKKEPSSKPIEGNVATSCTKELSVEETSKCETNTKHESTCKDEKENVGKDGLSKQRRRGRKSKTSRKSDPAVKSITELLNANLSIISPNTSTNADPKHGTNSEEQSPLAGKIKSPRSSSLKRKPRRSSSDFETPNSLKKHKSDLQLSSKKANRDKNSVEHCNNSESAGSKRKSQKLSSNHKTSDSDLITKKNEAETNHKSHKDTNEVQATSNSPEHFTDKIPVKSKKSSHEKSESRNIDKKAKKSKKGKVQDVDKMSTQSVTNDNTKNKHIVQNKAQHVVVIESDESPKLGDNTFESQETPKPKINAFQFMMESRFKSIGQNEDGNEISTNGDSEEGDNKQKRLSRKQMLENWVESKPNVKRKRLEEEEKDVYIKYQLEKRAKRLKKLLNPQDESSKENVKEKLVVEKESKRKSLRKRVVRPVVDSDSESSSDFVELKQSKHKTRVSLDKSLKDNNKTVLSKESSNNQNGLLSFLGITDKLKKGEIEDQNIVNVENTSSQIKLSKTSKPEKKLKEVKLESINKTRELVIEENANLDSPSSQKEGQMKGQIHTDKQATQSSIDEISLYGNTHCESSVDTCERSCSQDSISQRKGFQTPKLKKHRKKETMEDHLVGRSPRTWKMKIRLTDDEGTSDSFAAKKDISQESVQEVTVNEQSTSEQLEEEKTERPRRAAASSSRAKISKVILSSDSDGEVEIVSPQKKPSRSNVKLAPVFVKATPKPKIDPKVAQARRDFLMSGVPDQLKRDIERQISIEDIEVEVFPAISHVQQQSSENIYWDIPSPELTLMSLSPLKSDSINLTYQDLTSKHIDETISFCKTFQKHDICKGFIEQVKSKHPSYPVYKCFKSIYEKSGLKNKKAQEKNPEDDSKKKTPKKKRGRKKKENLDNSVEIIETPKEKFDLSDFAMWTEKYKPTASSDIIGNTVGVTQLKKWLEKWTELPEESIQRKKCKRNGSTSDSEFEYTDGDSRGSTCESKNTVILNGPHGSGKTSAVYAICTEFGMNVLELNASSKRTGKRLLQELQEATQSHQVMKGESTALSQFIKIERPKEKSHSEGHHSDRNKICVLLVEDIDVIFEQDEGFLSALTQLIATSKRPIILTTTDNTSPIICRFTTQYTVIEFKPLASEMLSVWLHIMCLTEGLSVDVQSIGQLLEKNDGDVRRTMLELQYWVQSGGNIKVDKQESVLSMKNSEDKQCSSDDKLDEDESSNMSFVNEKDVPQNDLESHTGCLESFEVTSYGKPFNIPYKMSLSKIWWNLPHIFSLQSANTNLGRNIPDDHVPKPEAITNVEKSTPEERVSELDELPEKHGDDINITLEGKKKKRLSDRKKLDAICEIYDSFLLTDLVKRGKDCLVDLEPCPRQWENALKDSLELTENLDNYSSSHDLTEDICHTLIDGCIQLYKKDNQTSYSINMGLPSIKDKRWRKKQHLCEDILQDAVSCSSFVDRRAVSVDFMPLLRQIGRSEMTRYSQNSKRGNRFNNYLRGLGIGGGDSSYKIVSNVLNIDNFKPPCL